MEARRAAKRARREQEERELAEKREQRRREARERVLAKRRLAIQSALPAAKQFFSAHKAVSNAWRTSLARRFLNRARRANATGSVESSHATNAAATIWQARFRSWRLRGEVVAAQGSLCSANLLVRSTEDRRASLFAVIPPLRAEAQTRLAAGQTQLAAMSDASDSAELLMQRELMHCSGRLALLRACASVSAGQPLSKEAVTKAMSMAVTALCREDFEPESDGGAAGGYNAAVRMNSDADDVVRKESSSRNASNKAASKFAELQAVTNRQRSMEERVSKLVGGAELAAKLIREHSGGAELLFGVQAHLLRAADSWQEQAEESEAQARRTRAEWQIQERLAAAERHGEALRKEIELSMADDEAQSRSTSPKSLSGDPSSDTGLGNSASPPSSRPHRRGSPSRRSPMLGQGDQDSSPLSLSAEWLTSATREAALAEQNAAQALNVICSNLRRQEWREASAAASCASGELVLIRVLASSQAAWDLHRQAIRLRSLRSSRISSVGVKLAQRRAAANAIEAAGGKRAVQALMMAEAEAQRTSRAFSTRTALRDALAAANAKLTDAQQLVQKITRENERAAAMLARQNKAASSTRGRALTPGSSTRRLPAGGGKVAHAAGGGGVGYSLMAEARALTQTKSAADDAQATEAVPAPEASSDRSNLLQTKRAALSAAKGEVEALAALESKLPPVHERMPQDWLTRHGTKMCTSCTKAEAQARAVDASLADQLRQRNEAKEALRAASKAQLQKGIRKVGSLLRTVKGMGGGAGAASMLTSKGMPPALASGQSGSSGREVTAATEAATAAAAVAAALRMVREAAWMRGGRTSMGAAAYPHGPL